MMIRHQIRQNASDELEMTRYLQLAHITVIRSRTYAVRLIGRGVATTLRLSYELHKDPNFLETLGFDVNDVDFIKEFLSAGQTTGIFSLLSNVTTLASVQSGGSRNVAIAVNSSAISSLVVTSHTLPFPKDGVRLSGLDEFVSKCGGSAALNGLTTTDVCNQYLKPLTQATGKSYCEELKAAGDPAVGTATVFISHAWAYKFLDVVEAIKYHFRDADDSVVIWFDLFSNNQHSAPNLDFDWWSTTFRSAIAQFGYVVVVLAPWGRPIPFMRAW